MATAAMQREYETSNGSSNGLSADRDTLFLVGGVALMVFGAGLILANPVVRKFISQMGAGSLATSALPDLERYLKLRSM